MFRSSLALVLVLLQGLMALPAPVNLCFERTGEFCCIGAGKHGCQFSCDDENCCEPECVHCPGHIDQTPGDSEQHAADVCRLTDSDDQHHRVAIYVPDGESLRSEFSSAVLDHFPFACDPGCAATIVPKTYSERCSTWTHKAAFDVVGFSLIARASVVLRC
jgi:hypothetical protein